MSKRVAIGAAVLALAAPLVMRFEGLSTQPYLDPIGIPTVCYGETHADMRSYTPAECQAMLLASLESHGSGIAACLPADLPDHQKAAALSFGYNVGAEKLCSSTFARKLTARDPTACAELSKWVYAGGKPLPGLVRRRAAERTLCEGHP
jgi:lysozyme